MIRRSWREYDGDDGHSALATRRRRLRFEISLGREGGSETHRRGAPPSEAAPAGAPRAATSLRIACTGDLRKVGVTFGVTTYLYQGSSYDTRSYRHNSDIWYRSVAVLTVPHSVGDDEPHSARAHERRAAGWSMGGSVAAAVVLGRQRGCRRRGTAILRTRSVARRSCEHSSRGDNLPLHAHAQPSRYASKLISRGPKRSQAPETEVEPPPWLEFEPEPGRRLS